VSKQPHNIQSAFADIRADYDATRHSRFVRRRDGVAAMGSGPDYHIRTESTYYQLIEQARDMDRNDGLVGILADRRVDNIVQSGFTLDPKTGDKGLDNALWQWWEDFSNDPDQCDITGEFTWKEIERQCCRSESIDGDIVVTGTEEGSFQLLESHLIRTKSKAEDTFLGVTTDRVGRRVQYHVADELSEFGQFGDVTPIDVRNAEGIRQVFHVFDPKRVNLTRGITQLAPVFALSGMLEDINFAKLVQQQVVSCFAVFRKMAAGGNRLPSADGYGDTKTETTPAGTRQLEGVSPGMEVIGQPGEELQGFSPNVPNSEYFQQVKLILQIIGVNFGLPLCLVLMDGSETNFSGWRGAVDEARKGFVADQMNLVRRLNKGAYKWRLWWELQQRGSQFRRSFSKLGDGIFRHNWNLPTWSYIEPVADAQGDAEQLKNALTSPRRLHAARGKDWEEIAEESIEDNAFAIQKAQAQAAKINANFPDSPPINWRDLIALPMPAGMTMAMQDPAAVAVQEDAANAETKAPEKPQARSKKKTQPRANKDFDEAKINRDDDGKFGGGGGGGSEKKEDRRFPGRPKVGEVVEKHASRIGEIKVVVIKSEDKEIDFGPKHGKVVDDAVQMEIKVGSQVVKTTKVGTTAEVEREVEKAIKKAKDNADMVGQYETQTTINAGGKDIGVAVVHDGFGGFHGQLTAKDADGLTLHYSDGMTQHDEHDFESKPRPGKFKNEQQAMRALTKQAEKYAAYIDKQDKKYATPKEDDQE
jgi:lambda family phage portal protein